ncbi:DNA polymerase Y family protein [Streptomyces aidingensis]|uniref:DNA polymerase-4 n=1 Tax=Streptomyces aidingensis TaxID=910347 RepID=A0A1I1JC21_9ACTN|nr:hypothetical protein [Streptomyces aidingensis]SFC42980.1 DNA polymerase-4 [Streptomyces aidingensis]
MTGPRLPHAHHVPHVPHVLYIRFEHSTEQSYPELLQVLHEITPVVQPLPYDAAFADVRGSLRYFGHDAAELARWIRVRALARCATDATIGVAANPLLARMTAQDGPPGAVRTLPADPEAVAAFLAAKPPSALPGVGRAAAGTLAHYGLDTLARIAAAPPATLQRVLGATDARRIRQLARGIDPLPVTPGSVPRSTAAEHRFDHDQLDPDARRRALLALADRLGHRLRREGQAARGLTLTVRYADRSITTRSRTLPAPSAHTPELAGTAYAMHDALALQRARVRSLALRATGLADADHTGRQLTLDPRDPRGEHRHRAEHATDRIRRKYGPRAAAPAATFPH